MNAGGTGARSAPGRQEMEPIKSEETELQTEPETGGPANALCLVAAAGLAWPQTQR